MMQFWAILLEYIRRAFIRWWWGLYVAAITLWDTLANFPAAHLPEIPNTAKIALAVVLLFVAPFLAYKEQKLAGVSTSRLTWRLGDKREDSSQALRIESSSAMQPIRLQVHLTAPGLSQVGAHIVERREITTRSINLRPGSNLARTSYTTPRVETTEIGGVTAFNRRFSSASKSRLTPFGFPILTTVHNVTILCKSQ